MSGSVLDFDEVAADDALIESLRAGASADELPADDAAVGVLLPLRDGASVDDEEDRTAVAVPGRAVVAGVVAHRRSIAVSAIVGVVATAGVGTAVAGDPTAAFSYLFRQGVEIGSRLGTPGGDVDTGSMGHAKLHDPPVAVRSVPVRQGSAAAQVSDDGETRGPVGFERGSRYWMVPAPRGLESLVGDDGDSAHEDGRQNGIDGFGDAQITDRATTVEPHETESPDPEEDTTAPPDEGGVDTDTDIDTDSDESTEPPPDDGATTLIQPPPETSTSPPPETTTSPPPETSTSPPPETSTSPPPETTAAPTETSPTESPSSPTATSSTQ